VGNVPRIEMIRLDWTFLLFVLVVTLLTTVLCGLAPALRSARANLQAAIKRRVPVDVEAVVADASVKK
jgi:hypothetical protein